VTAAASTPDARGRRAAWLLGILTAIAIVGPWLAPYDPARAFRDFLHAPPMLTIDRGWVIYPVKLVDRIEQRYEVDRSRTLAFPWFAPDPGANPGPDAGPDARAGEPVFLIGADSFGRDVFSRVLAGARLSIGVALASVLGAVLVGALLGAWAGYRGGWTDEGVMRVADLILVLPVLYVVLVLRAVLPLVLPVATVAAIMAAIFTAVGWPFVARGVRAIVSSERDREYAVAARAIGASHARVLFRHVLPACTGHLAVQATLLLPAFILAEATLSYVGLGFPDASASWGSMLTEAADVNVLTRFPWILAPAAAIFAVTLATNVMLAGESKTGHRA
jgi:peptide/nickel transport system permease protein